MDHRFPKRRLQAYFSALGSNQLHLRNPWVVSFFAFAFPGFGYLLLQRYLVGFTFIGWEVYINTKANINLGILYTLLGDFAKAKTAMHREYVILYVSMYLFNIWDSYRLTVDLNQQARLAIHEQAQVSHTVISAWDINFQDKKKPRNALVWSLLAPGVGHLYAHKVIAGFFILGATVLVMVLSHIPDAAYYSLIGDFRNAKETVDMQWLLYYPSMMGFIQYDAYVSVVEQNKLFEREQASYLQREYQSARFPMPLEDR